MTASPEPQLTHRSGSVRGAGQTLNFTNRGSMTSAMLQAQLEELDGEQIVYGCRPKGTNIRETTYYTGKLRLNSDGVWFVASSPLITAIGATSPAAAINYPIPHGEWEYSFIVSAVDWTADRVREADATYHPPSAFNNAPRTAPRPQPAMTAANVPLGAMPRNTEQAGPQLPDYLQDVDVDTVSEPNPAVNQTSLDARSALDPETWGSLCGNSAAVLQLRLHLTSIFPALVPAKQFRKDNAVTTDCIDIAVNIAEAMGAGASHPKLIAAAKTAIKRAYIIQRLHEGHSAEYVQEFSNAVEAQGAPSWISAAQRQATLSMKALTAAPQQYGKRDSFRGTGSGRGRGRGRGRGEGTA